jgi:hypothetical protein
MWFVNTFVITLKFTSRVSNISWVAGITALYVTVLEEGLSPSVLVLTDVSVYKSCVTVLSFWRRVCVSYTGGSKST